MLNRMPAAMLLATCTLATGTLATPAWAFDGWHTENVTMLPSKTSSYDYITYDEGTKHLFLGHRKEGLQVFDPATHTLIKTMDGTPDRSSNGATLIPEMDLGIINNEDGSFIPFKLSTLVAGAPVKLAAGMDTSHYDPGSKRIVFNVVPDKGNTELVVVDAATLKTVGTLSVPTGKAEGAVGDGAGRFYLAGQNEGKVFVLDTQNLKILDTFASPTCAKPTMVEVDRTAKRLFVACRSKGDTHAALVVLNSETGATVWTTEIGDGTDGLVYDAGTHRLFSANGLSSTLTVAEMVTPDSFKVVEHLGTMNNLKVLAMDHANQKLYSMVAEGWSDTARKGNLTVSPFYINSVVPNSFRVVTFSK